MVERLRTRFLVVGSGVAGLHTAWRAVEARATCSCSPSARSSTRATAYAQGGIAAALGAGDSPELHREDTLAAGAALCDAEAVQVLVEEGPARVRELQLAGAALRPRRRRATSSSGARRRTRATASCTRRATRPAPRSRARSSRRCARARDVDGARAARVLDLIVDDGDGRAASACARASPASAIEIIADATVLATGGCGQVYPLHDEPRRSPPATASPSRTAPASRLADMEFVQFHPTALDTPENPLVAHLRGGARRGRDRS